MSQTCQISEDLVSRFRSFKTKRNQANCAFIMKIDVKNLTVIVEDELENVTVEEVAQELPDAVPRFIAYSYKYQHEDGRESFPLSLIFFCPPGIKTELAMLYSSSKTQLVGVLQIMKVFDIQDSERLTEDWLREKLAFFK